MVFRVRTSAGIDESCNGLNYSVGRVTLQGWRLPSETCKLTPWPSRREVPIASASEPGTSDGENEDECQGEKDVCRLLSSTSVGGRSHFSDLEMSSASKAASRATNAKECNEQTHECLVQVTMRDAIMMKQNLN
jgi:hypothetical protein